MNESQVKRRGWIKNIVIIFLAVLLLLTLFSNTILNHSLPEVAVQYPQYSTIASRIRQTAVVEANQSYSVTIAQSRVISSVEVRVGASVQKGDVLFRLAEGDSTELAEANRLLQNLNIELIQKKKADPSLSGGSSSSMDDTVNTLKKSLSTLQNALAEARVDLAEAEEKLAELKKQQAALPGTQELSALALQITQIETNIEFMSEEISRLQGKQGQLGGDGYFTPAEIDALIADADEQVQEKSYLLMWALEDYDAAALLVKELQGITETAQKNFDNASQTYDEYASQISGNGVSYDTILQKQETISDLQKQLEQKQMYFTEAEYRAAYDRYIRAKQAFDEAYGKVSEEELQTIRTEMNTAAKELSPLETKYQEIQALQNRLSAAQQDYWQAMMQFSQSSQQNSTLTSLREVRDQEAVRLEAAQKKLAEAEADCSVKKKSFEEAKVALDDANTELKKVTGYREYDTLSDEIKEMKKQLAAMEDQKSDLEKKREASSDANVRALEAEIRAQNMLVTTEKRSVSEKEQEIRDLKADIAEAEKKASAKAELDKQNAQLTLQQYQIELEQIQDKIRKQEELVARLEENQVNGTVVAPVSGIIESLSVSAGQEAAANTPIASITLSDMGYTMKCTVTNEQAAKVNVGDVAEIQWYYWGDTPSARVVSIKTDPSSQGQRKTITLDVTGEVSPGTSLTFTLGSKNATYDCVVPNSAVREDSNGTFVLVVTAKDTPLGNRYSARRVDVEILASDETNSAVTGLASGEYVITKSSAPISSGMQVRLSENT